MERDEDGGCGETERDGEDLRGLSCGRKVGCGRNGREVLGRTDRGEDGVRCEGMEGLPRER